MTMQRRSRVPLRERAAQRGLLAASVLARREALGLRQDELADLVGCSPRFIHDVEAGKATLRLDRVLDVLNVLGLHLAVTDGANDQVGLSPALGAEFGLDPEHAHPSAAEATSP